MMAPREAYALWAATWDADAGALIALETAWMSPRLENVAGLRVVDAGCGTGRWLTGLRERGASAVGFDASPEMLAVAVAKGCAVGLADLCRLPVRDASADVVLCALSLGHMARACQAIGELARLVKPGGRLLISDFHPEAHHRGWRRTFRHGGAVHEVLHHAHAVADIMGAAAGHGLLLEELLEPGFDERQRVYFDRAGKSLEAVRGVPALLLARWRRPCS